MSKKEFLDLTDDKSMLTAEEFLEALKKDEANIAKATFKRGDWRNSSSGHFEVEWKNRRYGKLAYGK